MVPAGVGVDLGSTAKLAGTVYKGPLQHAPVGQILDQGCQRLIKLRQQGFRQGIEVVAVRIPPAQGNGDKADPRFDETPSRQHALAETRSGHSGRGFHFASWSRSKAFLFVGTAKYFHCLLVEGVQGGGQGGAAPSRSLRPWSKSFHQPGPLFQFVQRQAAGQQHPPDTSFCL